MDFDIDLKRVGSCVSFAEDVDDFLEDFADEIHPPPPPEILSERKESHVSVHFREGRRDFDFLEDDPRDMTYGRRIAMHLMKYEWYYPRRRQYDIDENKSMEDSYDSVLSFSVHGSTTFRKASLAKAWAYFEHVTLPRYIRKEDGNEERTLATHEDDFKNRRHPPQRRFKDRLRKASKQFRQESSTRTKVQRAIPGEMHKPTNLYSVFATSVSQMGDFGLGTGMYFTGLRTLTVMTFIMGLINIPTMLFYSSVEYSGGQGHLSIFLRGSAICSNTTWVPCPQCNMTTQWRNNMDRIATATTEDGDSLIFALRNNCNGARYPMARINFLTLIILGIGLIALRTFQKEWERSHDESDETARVYTIVIKNPPETASNPDEWKRYFETKFRAKVAVVTIGIDNDLLVRSLVARREVLRRLELALDPGKSLDVLSLAKLSSKIEHERNSLQRLFSFILPGIPELFGRLTVLTARVQGLAQQDYKVRNVFITFEKESTTLRILSEFAMGDLAIHGWIRDAAQGKRHLYFRDRLLKIRQPEEPAAIRWQDLNSKAWNRILELLSTNLIGLGVMALFAYLITFAFERSTLVGAVTISLSSLVYQEFAKGLTALESHFSEGDVQASLYFKLGLFRFVNTAIIISVITPFTSSIQEESGLIPKVYAIFVAELVAINAARLADPLGHFQRHVLAPRERTQDAMNIRMRGTSVELAERVTDMTKIVFLTFWYSTIFPFGLFCCSFVLWIKHYTDRFGLMRSWKRFPPLGNRIAVFSRRYFISASVVAMATISSYAWSGFPYDNLCENPGRVNLAYVGNWVLTTGATGKAVQTSVEGRDKSFRYCLQDLLRSEGPSFPAIPANQPEGGEWMTTEQEKITQVFGWTSVICVAVVAVTIVWNWSDAIAELFVLHHKQLVGKKAKREFHKVLEESTISTYIPDVKSNLFPYPLILCNTDGIDDQIYTWKDSEHPYSYYDLTKDAKKLTEGIGLDVGHAFSSLRHYRPNECLPPEEEGAYDCEGSLAQDNQMPLRGSVQDEVEELEYQALLSEVKENDTNEMKKMTTVWTKAKQDQRLGDTARKLSLK